MHTWKKGLLTWKVNGTLYISVVFTWQLPEAEKLALAHGHKNKVIVGGPAVLLMPSYLKDVATIRETTNMPVLSLHNAFATFTSRGCVNQCSFCSVPRIEGGLVELKTFDVKPLICDNNFLACSKRHFDNVIDLLKQADYPLIDFNQGLDCRLFDNYHARRLAELRHVKVRFAFDNASQEKEIVTAIERAKKHKLTDITVYVLIGHEDNPEDALYRLELLRSLNVLSYPQRYQPLYALSKNEFVGDNWTDYELKKMQVYFSNLSNAITYFGKVPYSDWYNHCCENGEMIKRFGLRKGKKLGLDADMPLKLKSRAGAIYTAQKKKTGTIKKLSALYKKLSDSKAPITQKLLAEKSGLSLTTIKTYWKDLK